MTKFSGEFRRTLDIKGQSNDDSEYLQEVDDLLFALYVRGELRSIAGILLSELVIIYPYL